MVAEKYFTKTTYPLKRGVPLYVGEGSHRVIIEYQGGKKKPFEYDVNFSIIEDDDRGVIGYLVSFEDTEKHKVVEKEMQLEDLVAEDEIAASYVHELKNPLFSIRGFLQILRQSFSDDDERKSYTDIAINELDRMNNLLNDYLSRYKAHNTARIKTKEGISVKEVIEELKAFFQHSLYLKGISYEIEFEDNGLLVSIGKEQLMQVLINIVKNSIEAMNKGARLSIKAFKEDDWVNIQIKDEGVGIKKSDLDKIFRPFYSTKQYGTGLGLYITKRIVESNGGSISVESEEGKGTTTYLKFPKAG